MTSSKLNEITTELDTVARKYVLDAKSGPYRQMTPGGPTAYVTATQDDIRKLMADVQYAEFEPYGEVLVAEKAASAPYDKLDIQIPRPRNYTVYVNERSFGTETNVDKELQFNSGKDARYYDNESVTFTIRELENGQNINGVKINIDEEKIHVTVNASPKTKKISICLNRIDNNTVIFNNPPAFSLTYGGSPITFNRNHDGSLYFSDSLRTYDGNWLRLGKDGIWEMKVSGNSFERGYAIGQMSSDLLYYQENVFVEQIRRLIPSDSYLKFLRFFIIMFNRNLGENVDEEYRNEIYGISASCTHEFDAIGTPYERQMQYHSAHDIGHAMQDFMMVGCTSFAAWDGMTAASFIDSACRRRADRTPNFWKPTRPGRGDACR